MPKDPSSSKTPAAPPARFESGMVERVSAEAAAELSPYLRKRLAEAIAAGEVVDDLTPEALAELLKKR